MTAIRLKTRNVIRISGTDAEAFLQGMITNDLGKASQKQAIYAALLTPQGKYLFDFFILRDETGFLFDVEAARRDDLIKKFSFYKLRADVAIEDQSDDYQIWAFTESPPDSGNVYRDPRFAEAGWRGILAKGCGQKETAKFEDFENHRLALGLPDGSRDIEVDKRFILEANFRELNGVDFKKGCYVGQEMTARMTYRSSLKKRLLPVRVSGALPAPDSKILSGGAEAGHFRSGQGNLAIALIRLEYLGQTLTTEGGDAVTVIRPGWLKDH